MRSSQQLTLVLLAVFAATLAPAVFNYVVDPYQIFHEIDGEMPDLHHDSRRMTPSLIKHCLERPDTKFDTVIIGSSMGQNFVPSEVQSMLGSGRVLKLNMPGTLPEMDLMVVETVLKSPNVKRVLWELTPHYQALEPTPLEDIETFPRHLYGDDWSDIARTLFSADTTTASQRTLKQGRSSIAYEDWNKWYREDEWEQRRQTELIEKLPEYNARVLEAHPRDEPILDQLPPRLEVLDYPIIERVVELICSRPDVQFDLFFPPRSTLYYAQKNDDLVRLFQMQPNTVRRLSGLPGAAVHGFDDVDEVVKDLTNYKDLGHYSPKINNWMAMSIADRTHLLTIEDVGSYQQRRHDLLRQVIEEVHAGTLDHQGTPELPAGEPQN